MSSARVFLLTLGWLAFTQPAAADVAVGSGQASSCTEAAFGAAVASVSTAGGTITFDCGGPATITLTSQKVLQNLSSTNLVYAIDGGGIITLNGGATTRILYHTTGTLNLRNITFTGGQAQGAADNASGGAVRSDSDVQVLHLNLTNVTFNGNSTNLTTPPSPPFSPYDYGGGALFTRFGIVTIANCSFNNNTANNTAGGALHIRSSTVTITGSLFNANASNAGGMGGAIYVDGLSPLPSGTGGTLQILTTRINGNTTRNQGGAIFFYLYPAKSESVTFDTISVTGNQIVDSSGGPSGTQAFGGGISGNYGNVTILNSTFANNTAHSNTGGGSGGGILLSGNGAITIWNSTISGNRGEGAVSQASGGGLTIFNNTQPFDILHATIANNFAGYSGGGIYTNASGTLRNSIVANNTSGLAFGQQCVATLSGGGVIQWPDNNPSCISGVAFTDPLLAPLAFNGGFSDTHLPGAGSPAIDAGACAVSRDQRGVSRPQGPFCDLGAVEVAPPPPAINYFTLSPCRVLDTRLPAGPTGGAPLICGVDQVVTLTGGTCVVPASAKAVAGNVAVTQPSQPGTVNVFPAGSFVPQTSTVNYSAGQTRANNAVIPLSGAGQVAVRCSPSGTAHVIIDVSGYFQ